MLGMLKDHCIMTHLNDVFKITAEFRNKANNK